MGEYNIFDKICCYIYTGCKPSNIANNVYSTLRLNFAELITTNDNMQCYSGLLDYWKTPFYSMSVIVSDGQFSTEIDLGVNIVNGNDHDPEYRDKGNTLSSLSVFHSLDTSGERMHIVHFLQRYPALLVKEINLEHMLQLYPHQTRTKTL